MTRADVVRASRAVWTSGVAPAERTIDCAVQLRAHGMTSVARVDLADDGLIATLTDPQYGVAAGQAVVMYDGDVVIGSATITATEQLVRS